MKKIGYYIASALVVFAAGSCQKIDNYKAPDQTLKGTIIDSGTGLPVQSEISGDNGSGTRIKLLEISWSANPTPLYLATMQDGTYNNTKVFAATYKMTAEGAFVPMVQTTPAVDRSQTVVVQGGTTTVNFSVEPYLEVQWVGNPVINANGTVTVQAKITRGTTNPLFQQDVIDLWLFASPTIYCGNNNYDSRYSTHLAYTGTAGDAILGTTITLTTTGVLPKKDWYLRVGSRINYGLLQYNYSDIRPVTIQ